MSRLLPLAMAGTLLLAGCAMLGPSEQEVQALQTRIASIDARTRLLEQARGGARSARGEDETAALSEPPVAASGSWAGRALRKGLRGGVNLVTGWVEIPKRAEETMRTSGVTGELASGILRGIGRAVVRTAVGAYELVTFPIPAPADYQPIVQPEFVFQPD